MYRSQALGHFMGERTNIKYDRNRMKRRCCRDAYTNKVCKWIKTQGCTAVWFGTGACKCKGHRPVPTKSMMRSIGRYLPVLAGNEWGTSSRCPSCKDGTRLTSWSDKKKVNRARQQKHTLFGRGRYKCTSGGYACNSARVSKQASLIRPTTDTSSIKYFY